MANYPFKGSIIISEITVGWSNIVSSYVVRTLTGNAMYDNKRKYCIGP